MPKTKPVLLYFYPALSSFVVKDLKIMELEYEVRHMGFLPAKKWQTPLVWLQQLFFLFRNITTAKVLVSMFSGYHSFFPALFGKIAQKPCLIVAGGTDCVAFPSIGYGCFAKPILGTFTRWSYQLASYIAPVHEKLVWQDYSYQANDFPHQGYMYHCPNLKTAHTVVYNGYDSNFWFPEPSITRQPASFLTVCAGLHMRFTQKLKGIDIILEAALLMPEATFTIVGAPEGFTFQNQAPNVKLLPKMTLENLKAVYSAHTFYLQLSLSEGFPNALSESMLCGCIPLVSEVGGMPDIIGGTGYVVKRKDVKVLKETLQQALQSDLARQSSSAREKIQNNYPESRRQRELIDLIAKLWS